MSELLPISTGLILGVFFAAGPKILSPTWIKAIVVVLVGISATVVSGEYRESLGFAIVDIGEVLLAAWIASFAVRRLLARRANQRISSTS